MSFGLWYDFRNPAAWERPAEELYRRSLDQVAWAEELGYDAAWLTEHHFCDDGYTPSPLLLLSAIAARTRRMRIGTNLMVISLHDPLRLAEDAATLAIASDGRFDLGVGVGYRELEFEAFGRSLRHRPSLIEESVEILRRAWSGEPVAFQGRRFTVPGVRVTPVPARPPRILMGGNSQPARARAARLADGFLAPNDAAFPLYLEEHARAGREPRDARITAVQFVVIADDPERVWATIGEHALYQLNTYVRWGGFGPPETTPTFASADEIIAAGAYRLWDGPRAVEELVALLASCPQVEDIHWSAQLPGEDIESGSERIEYAARKVLPKVRERLALTGAHEASTSP